MTKPNSHAIEPVARTDLSLVAVQSLAYALNRHIQLQSPETKCYRLKLLMKSPLFQLHISGCY